MWIDDQIIEHCSQPAYLDSFVPSSPVVVLGANNKPSLEVFEEHCAQDKVPILKRYGGGGTVVLYDGCVVVSYGAWVKEYYDNQKYFRLLNDALIRCLTMTSSIDFCPSQNGLSDIEFEGKKFVGTSLFRSRNYLLYQASILVDLDLAKINRYLRFPSRVPEYRANRSHDDFLTCLSRHIEGVRPTSEAARIKKNGAEIFRESLEGELIDPVNTQMPHLLRRISTASLG